jgi:hypothetical protein
MSRPPIEQIPLFVRGGAVLPLLGTPVVSLANTGPAELLANLELRFAPTGSPGTAGFTFHDGSTVVVREDERRVVFDFGEEFQGRRVVVRVPRATEIAHASADGVEIPFAINDPGQDARWDAVGNPGTVVRTSRGARELVLRIRQ